MINLTEIATCPFDYVYASFAWGKTQMHLFILSIVYLIKELALSLIR